MCPTPFLTVHMSPSRVNLESQRMAVFFISSSRLPSLEAQSTVFRRRTLLPLRRSGHATPTGSTAQPRPLVRVRTSLPAVLVKGSDRISFVNGMGTNAFAPHIKEPVETVFTSNTGRCVDLVTALQYEEFVLLLSSLSTGELYKHLDRYIFPADEVEITQLLVPQSIDVLATRADEIDVPSYLQVLPTTFGSTILRRELQEDGHKDAPTIPSDWVATLGTFARDEAQWERERVQLGIPEMGKDITSQNNPLEAGLWHYVSFEKGCYIGQETIARLNTYDGVKEVLCLIEFQDSVEAGAEIEGTGGEARAAGRITSVSRSNTSWRALGYVRRKSGLADISSEVYVRGIKGVVLDSPFLKRGYENRSLLTL